MTNGNFLNGLSEKMQDEERREQLPASVYYVKSPEDDTVLVGMDVEISRRGGDTTVSWFDTVKERRMGAELVSEDMDNFTFKRLEQEGGGTYSFVPMSLDVYDNSVKSYLQNGKDFDNQEDLTAAFLETKKDVQ
jgi:hypothetical protein